MFVLRFWVRAAVVPAASWARAGPSDPGTPLLSPPTAAPEAGSGHMTSFGCSVGRLWPSSPATPHSQLTKYLVLPGLGLLSSKISPHTPTKLSMPLPFPVPGTGHSQPVSEIVPGERAVAPAGRRLWGYCGKPVGQPSTFPSVSSSFWGPLSAHPHSILLALLCVASLGDGR